MTSWRTPLDRLLLLTGSGALLGFAGGGAAWVLLHLIRFITNAAVFGHLGVNPPTFRHLHTSPRLFVVAVLGALIVSLLAKWAPVIRGHGIPEAMEVVLTKRSRISPQTAVAKPISAAIAIGTSAPFGAEGPIIVTGGALGSLLGQVIHVSAAERKILLACGAAAGMAATFGAPLASVMLAVELLLFEFSARSLLPLIVATCVAGAVHTAIIGTGPLFHVPAYHYPGLGSLPAFALLGLACGVLAAVVVKGLFLVETAYRRLPVSEFWHPMIGAVLFVAVGSLAPRALGVGYDAIGDVLTNRLTLGTVAVLGLVKLVSWWFALGSGTSGGTLAPILLISASFGALAGNGINHVLPGPAIALGAFAVVAMAATFGAATRATFTSIVFVFELTRNYNVVVPLMLAVALADLVFNALSEHSIMTEKLHRRGVRVGRFYGVDPLVTTTVAEIMSQANGTHPRLDGPVVTSLDRAITALDVLLDNDIAEVPVVDGGELVGVCTHADLLRARAHDRRAERRLVEDRLNLRRRRES
ncbi:MAG: hypothetical protein QOJ00_2902 [Actinomycetota bacterium]|jgi:H+/Cl- antiporter ClcA